MQKGCTGFYVKLISTTTGKTWMKFQKITGGMMYPHVREHAEDDGCYGCCDDCNYDAHRCRMCGTPIAHKLSCCDDCHAELKERDECTCD